MNELTNNYGGVVKLRNIFGVSDALQSPEGSS